MYAFLVHTEQNEVRCSKYHSNAYLEKEILKFTIPLLQPSCISWPFKDALYLKRLARSSISSLPPSFGLYIDKKKNLMEKIGEGKCPIYECRFYLDIMIFAKQCCPKHLIPIQESIKSYQQSCHHFIFNISLKNMYRNINVYDNTSCIYLLFTTINLHILEFKCNL